MALSRPGRFAVVSHALPPWWSGQAVILYKLLRDVDPARYVLISSHATMGPAAGEFIERLPADVFELAREPSFARFGVGRSVRAIEAIMRIWLRGRRVAKIARACGCDAIVACTGDLLDLPAASLAARWLRARFYPYLFDDYTFQWTDPMKRSLAAWLEPRMFRNAAGVIVPNEFLARDIERRDGVSCTVVRNASDPGVVHGLDLPWPSVLTEVRIVYTGAVYHAHYDAFRNLIVAITKLGRPEVRLHLYTTQDPKQLESEGISGPVVVHPHVPAAEVAEIQRYADILFLPLAFRSAIPEVVRTSAPGKTAEYLASGRPVLVHAPADGFVSWYFRAHDCGTVVDVPDPALLAAGLREILEHPDLRRARAENARRQALEDFALERARARLLGLVGGGTPPP